MAIWPFISVLIQINAEAALTSYTRNRSKSAGERKVSMSQASTWQRRKGPRLSTWSLRRWLVLLLVLAFSASGLVHIPMGDHSASAASLAHEIASAGEDVTAEPNCAGDADDATCCIASVCSFCVPMTASATIARAMVAGIVAALPDEVLFGRAPSPRFRPPSLSANA